MDPMLMAGIGLILLGVLLIVVEAFVPSHGIIGLTAATCAIVGVVVLFRYDTTWGTIGLLVTLILGPMMFFWTLKLLPSTPLGKKMFGDSDEDIAARRDLSNSRWREERNALIDQRGVALTDLHPVGMVRINGARHDAIAQGPIIDKDDPIRVVKVDGMQIEVRRV